MKYLGEFRFGVGGDFAVCSLLLLHIAVAVVVAVAVARHGGG